MSLQFNVNLTPTTGSVAIYNLKAWLIAQGWTVPRSSDGTTYNSTGDQISSGNTGANGLANNNAWFVAQMPLANGVNRQLCFQRGTTNLVWRIKYSYSAGFTGGTPGATQTPSATDEEVMYGAGTDAAPTFTTMFPTDGTYHQNIAAQNTSPYGFWHMCYTAGLSSGASNQAPRSVMMLDPLVSGSYPTGDIDPYVLLFSGASGTFDSDGSNSVYNYNALNTNPASCFCWMAKGLAGQGFVSVTIGRIMWAGGTIGLPGALGPLSRTNQDTLMPAFYGRRTSQTAPQGYKGQSTFVKLNSVVRSTLDTLSINSTSDHICFSYFVFDWNGSVPTV